MAIVGSLLTAAAMLTFLVNLALTAFGPVRGARALPC